MGFIATLLLWFVLLAIAWPLALLALFLMPILWLLSIPFRIFGVVLSAALGFLSAVLFLPARLLGHRR